MEAIRKLKDTTNDPAGGAKLHHGQPVAERFVIIDDGKSVHRGLMSDLVQDQDLIHQYLGASIQAPVSKSEA